MKIEPASDITILYHRRGALSRAGRGGQELKEKYGMEAEVIDARTHGTLQLFEKVLASVKKTGRIVLVSDACQRGSFLQRYGAQHHRRCAFDDLDAPPVGDRRKELDHSRRTSWSMHFFPQPEWIVDAIHQRILPLPGHICTHNCTELEQIRENRLGI